MDRSPMRQQLVEERDQKLPAVACGPSEKSPLPETGSCGEDILGLSIPLMTLGHLSEPFIDGLASSPKGCCPPSCSAHSWEAGRWVGAFAAVTRASSHRKKRCGVFNFLLSSNSEKLFLWKQYLHT